MAQEPSVTILLIGDPDCGKSTFLSRISHGKDGVRGKVATDFVLLRDMDQPFTYDIRMYNRPYRFQFYDTASPENYTLLRPDFIILCYDISNRHSLVNVQHVWRKEASRCYQTNNEALPIMLLGLKRDQRVEGSSIIYPQEGYRIAQEMRCDRYAECSAISGELMNEVFEDIARIAARTTTEAGALSEPACSVQ